MGKPTESELAQLFPVLAKSGPGLAAELLRICRNAAFPKDKIIYVEGDSCQAIALVLAGEIRVFKTAENGREILLYEIGKGETCILNASCILSNIPYPADAVAMTDIEVLLCPAGEFRRLMGLYEPVREFVFGVLNQRLTEVMALIEEVAFGRMDQRLLAYLAEHAGGDGMVQTTHQRIANDLGTSREVVSRLLKGFEHQGKVSLARNQIRLIAP